MASYTQWIPVTGETGYPDLISAFMTQIETDVTNLENAVPTKIPKLATGTPGHLVKIDTISGIETAGIHIDNVILKGGALTQNQIAVVNGIQTITTTGINFEHVAQRDGQWTQGNLVVVDSNDRLVDGGPPSAAGSNDSVLSLTDTIINSLQTNDLLVWNNTLAKWLNLSRAAANIADRDHTHTLQDMTNVTISSVAAGEILKWNGAGWVNNTLAEANIRPANHVTAVHHGGTGLTNINVGSVFTGNGTGSVIGVPPGSPGRVLTDNGALTTPSWQVPEVQNSDFWNGSINFGNWTAGSKSPIIINTGFGTDNFVWGVSGSTVVYSDYDVYGENNLGWVQVIANAASAGVAGCGVGCIRIHIATNGTPGTPVSNIQFKLWARKDI